MKPRADPMEFLTKIQNCHVTRRTFRPPTLAAGPAEIPEADLPPGSGRRPHLGLRPQHSQPRQAFEVGVARKKVTVRGLAARRDPNVVRRDGRAALFQILDQTAIDPRLAGTHTPFLDLGLIEEILQLPPIFLIPAAVPKTEDGQERAREPR